MISSIGASLLVLCLSCLSEQCTGFVAIHSISKHTSSHKIDSTALRAYGTSSDNDRREFLNRLVVPLAVTGISTIVSPGMAEATLMSNDVKEVKTFKAGEKLSIEEAKNRFKLAIADVDELIENYGEIANGGGDNVRRYLGTVGVKSHMYGITKVLKELRDEADDIVEFTEASNEFEAYLFQAEGAAYQSLFVEHSSAKGTPQSLLATAKKDVLSMRKFMGELAIQVHLDA